MANVELATVSPVAPNATAHTSPIGQLPVELVLIIIQALIDTINRKDSVLQTVHSLSLIDHRFNDLVNATPALWTRLSARDPPKLLSKAMQMATSQHLEIICEGYTFANRFRYKSAMEAFLRIVVPACDRWRSIDVWIPDDALDQISDILSLPTPALQVMKLDGYSHSERPPLRPFCWSINGLKKLHVGGISVDWSSCTFSGLTSLQLSNGWYGRSIPALQVLEWLTASPDLASLTLMNVSVDPSINPTSFDSIRLPKLTLLTLNNVRFTRELLETVRMPALKYLNIEEKMYNRSITSLFDNRTTHLYPAILSSLSQTSGTAELILAHDDAWLRSEAINLRLRGLMPYDIFLSTPAAVEPLLSSIPLALQFDGFDILHQGFLQTLTAVTRIQQIVLTYQRGVAELFKLLATPGANGFPCPELTVLSLDLDTSSMAGAIQAMVESRYGRNRKRGGAKRPAPLRLIYLSQDGWTTEMASRLADVVGENHIQWGNCLRLVPEV